MNNQNNNCFFISEIVVNSYQLTLEYTSSNFLDFVRFSRQILNLGSQNMINLFFKISFIFFLYAFCFLVKFAIIL